MTVDECPLEFGYGNRHELDSLLMALIQASYPCVEKRAQQHRQVTEVVAKLEHLSSGYSITVCSLSSRPSNQKPKFQYLMHTGQPKEKSSW